MQLQHVVSTNDIYANEFIREDNGKSNSKKKTQILTYSHSNYK